MAFVRWMPFASYPTQLAGQEAKEHSYCAWAGGFWDARRARLASCLD